MMPNDPVQKSFVNLSLMGGLNKKKDTHQLQNGELLTAENVVFTAVEGQVTKRYGFAAVTPAGAPFQGGPFKALGVRDNTEPLILGANTLNKYNVAKNLSTALPTPTQGRVSVKQSVGSTGQSSTPWPPSHASCATDGTSYCLVTWDEPNGQGALIYYGVQDLATGGWIIQPQKLPIVVTSLPDTNAKASNYQCAFAPKAMYANGCFFISYMFLGMNSTGAYQGFVTAQYLPLTNLAGGWSYDGFFYMAVTGATASTFGASPTIYSYDMAMGYYGSQWNWICAIQGSTNNKTTQIQTGSIGTGGKFFFNGSNTQTWSNVTNPTVSVRAETSGQYPFSIALPDYQASLNLAGAYVNNLGWAGSNPFRAPVDAMNYGTAGFCTLTYDLNATRMAVICRYGTTNSGTGNDSKFASGLCTYTAPVQTGYMQILSRMFRKASEPIVYAWIGCASGTSDSIYNSAYLVEFNFDTQATQTICRTLYLSSDHVTGGDEMWPTDLLQIPSTKKFVTFLTAITEKVGATDFHGFGTLNRVEFDFAPDRNVQILALATGGNLIAGSYPLYYDGATVNEAGFSSAPVGSVMSQTNAPILPAGGSVNSISVTAATVNSYVNKTLQGGTSTVTASGSVEYYYVICFVRRDAYGNVHRSSPSPVITVPCPNTGGQYFPPGTSPNTIGWSGSYPWGQQVQFPGFQYNGGGNVMIEYYRSTQNVPGTFYFIGQVANGTPFLDTNNDGSNANAAYASIMKNRTVYTNANELPNDPPPPIWHAVASESRVYCIPADNRNLVWYSKQFAPGRTVEWCAALTMSEGLNSGQFMGLAILDSNLIIFKADQVLYTWGNGPDNTGSNGTFAPFTRIASDVGCIDAGSIVVIPDGVVFKSRRGIEMLTRALQIVYIGSDVEPLVQASGPIASVVTIPNFTETRFVPSTAGQPVLCYDYSGKRWSTFSNMAAVQAAPIFGNYWFISADGTLVNQETPNSYTDNGTPIVMTLETPEIPVGSGGAQGWGRAYRMALLGDFFNDFIMTVQFAYDHSNTYTNAVQFSTATGLINGDKVFQFRTSRLPRQVMQTLRLKIQDNGTSGQACAISNIALEVGSKNGLAKLADQKTL